MGGERRRQFILESLLNSDFVSVLELASMTQSSMMTIRRDLDLLSARGLLHRVHGGAVPVARGGPEQPYAVREIFASEAKRAIARAAVELIEDGQSVVLDRGTTATEVARLLVHRSVTVVPLSLHCARILMAGPRVRVLLPGGDTRPGELSFVGPITVASLRTMRFDLAILVPCGLSIASGLTVFDDVEATTKQQAIAVARRIVGLADGSKWGRIGPAEVCPVERLDVLITDSTAPAGLCTSVRREGVDVRTVDLPAPVR